MGFINFTIALERRPESEVLLELIDFERIPIGVFVDLIHNESLQHCHFSISQVSFVSRLYEEIETLSKNVKLSTSKCEEVMKENVALCNEVDNNRAVIESQVFKELELCRKMEATGKAFYV
jgi:hypothetical protein